MNTCPQFTARFRGAEAVSRHFLHGLTLTIAATFALSLSVSTALAQAVAIPTGTGDVPVTVKPITLTFYKQLVGTRSIGKTVTFTNDGTVDVSFTNISIAGVNADQFTFTTTCGITGEALGPGASCTTTVYFSPTFGSAVSAILQYNGNFTTQAVFISATGTAVVVNPDSLTFPKTTVGSTSAAKTSVFKNVGPTALPIDSVGWTGAELYFNQTNTCGTSVPAKSSCTFSVTFSPLAAGTCTATLWIGDPDSSGPQKITVTGTGVK